MHSRRRARGTRKRPVLRAGIAVLTAAIAATAFPANAAADATDDYPIPHRMIITTCTSEQVLAAARDFAPIYFERYIIDKHNRSPEVQQAAIVDASLDDRVELDRTEPRVLGGGDPVEHALERKANPVHGLEHVRVQGVQTDGDPAQARLAER